MLAKQVEGLNERRLGRYLCRSVNDTLLPSRHLANTDDLLLGAKLERLERRL